MVNITRIRVRKISLPERGKFPPESGKKKFTQIKVKGVCESGKHKKDKLTKNNIKPFFRPRILANPDQPEKRLPVEKPDAAIQSGSR